MNENQQQLLNFILDRVGGEHHDEIKKAVGAHFDDHNSGKADVSSLAGLIPQIASMIKPENKEEITGLLSNLGKNPEQVQGLLSSVLGGGDAKEGEGGGAMEQVMGLLKKFS